LWSCFTLLTPLAAEAAHHHWIGWIIIARIGLGVGEGVNFPATTHLTGIWAPKSERTRISTFMNTGLEFGTLTALLLGPAISIHLGWQWTFYIFGCMGIAWSFVYFFVTSATPQDNLFISDYEQQYLRKSLIEEEGGAKEDTKLTLKLFGQIMTNRGVWAVIIAHTCYNYGWYVLLSFLPKLFLDLGVSFDKVGYISMLPYIVVAIGSNLSGQLSDFLINRQVSVQNVRKIMQCTALIVPSILFFLLRWTRHSLVLSTIIICAAIGASSCCRSGHNVNMIDLSPRLSGLLFSVSLFSLPNILDHQHFRHYPWYYR
jgi:predicted MFS family arabinose efflux permease